MLGQRRLRRFFEALTALKSDPELRSRYFDDPTALVEVEHYEAQDTWVAGFEPSLHYLESKADGVIRGTSAGYVVQTCDDSCPKWDAARHVAGLKRGVIVLPQDADGRAAWYREFREWDKWLSEIEGEVTLAEHSRWRA